MFSSTSLLFYLFGGCSTCHHSAAKWDILLGVRDVPRSGKQIFGLVMPIPQMCLTPPIFSQVISPHPKPNISHSEHVFGMSTPEKITKNSFTSNAPVVHSQLVWTPASLCFITLKWGAKFVSRSNSPTARISLQLQLLMPFFLGDRCLAALGTAKPSQLFRVSFWPGHLFRHMLGKKDPAQRGASRSQDWNTFLHHAKTRLPVLPQERGISGIPIPIAIMAAIIMVIILG